MQGIYILDNWTCKVLKQSRNLSRYGTTLRIIPIVVTPSREATDTIFNVSHDRTWLVFEPSLP